MIISEYQLDSEKEKMLRLYYGVPLMIPVSEYLSKPPSPREALISASKYVVKTHKKMYKTSDIGKEFDGPIFKMLEKGFGIKKEGEKEEIKEKLDLEKTHFFTDPIHKKWQKCDCVTKICKELYSFPYWMPSYAAEAERSFRESVASIVNKMNQLRMIGKRRATKKYLNEAMNYFITHVTQARKEFIAKHISDQKILWNYLPKKYQVEFADLGPNKEEDTHEKSVRFIPKFMQRSNDDEKNIDLRIENAGLQLPPMYRCDLKFNVGVEDLQDKLKKTFNGLEFASKKLHRPATAIAASSRNDVHTKAASRLLRRPKILISSTAPVSPKIYTVSDTKKSLSSVIDKHRIFWDEYDPLSRPLTAKSSIHQLKEISNEVTFDCDQDKISSEVFGLTNTMESEDRDEQQDTQKNDELDSKLEPEEEEEKVNKLETASPATADTSDSVYRKEIRLEALEILNSFTDDVKASSVGAGLHDELNKIWEKLGFSVSQKLQMVIKYSVNASESAKLAEVLGVWKLVLEMVEYYDEKYRSLKKILKFSDVDAIDVNTVSSIIFQMKSIEHKLTNICQKIQTEYYDEVIIKGTSLKQLLERRHAKLRQELCKYGLEQKLD